MTRTWIRVAAMSIAALHLTIFGVHGADMSWPRKPIRILVPYPGGASGDLAARLIAQRMAEAWGQPVIVDNRAGGAGIAATELVARAAPDGYTLLLTGMNHVTNVGMYDKLPFDTMRDFTEVSLVGSVGLALIAHPSTGFRSAKDMIDLARQKPGTINCSSGGNGTGGHLACALFARSVNVSLVHVPYKGATPAVSAVVSGEVQTSFTGVPPALGFIKEGRLLALLVTTAKRLPTLPTLPTAQEFGIAGYEVDVWFGMLGRAGTPAPVVKQLSEFIAKTVAEPDFRARMSAQGLDPIGSTSAEFAAVLRKDFARWPKFIREAGIRAE